MIMIFPHPASSSVSLRAFPLPSAAPPVARAAAPAPPPVAPPADPRDSANTGFYSPAGGLRDPPAADFAAFPEPPRAPSHAAPRTRRSTHPPPAQTAPNAPPSPQRS